MKEISSNSAFCSNLSLCDTNNLLMLAPSRKKKIHLEFSFFFFFVCEAGIKILKNLRKNKRQGVTHA